MSDLRSYFVSGSVFEWKDGTRFSLDVVEAGQLSLRSGRLVACDPGWPIQSLPADVRTLVSIPQESYPVSLSVVRTQSGRQLAQVAAARITVRSDLVARWTPAREKPGSEGSQALGFSVDSGLGCFLDDEAVPLLAPFEDDDDAFEEIAERAMAEQFTEIVDEATGLNVIVFACGLGDGTYPVWLGLTSDGEVAQIVADLEALSHCTPVAVDDPTTTDRAER